MEQGASRGERMLGWGWGGGVSHVEVGARPGGVSQCCAEAGRGAEPRGQLASSPTREWGLRGWALLAPQLRNLCRGCFPSLLLLPGIGGAQGKGSRWRDGVSTGARVGGAWGSTCPPLEIHGLPFPGGEEGGRVQRPGHRDPTLGKSRLEGPGIP